MNFSNIKSKIPHPVINELRFRLEDARTELMSLVENWFHLKFNILPELSFTYDGIFGELEEELAGKSQFCSNQEHELRWLSEELKIDLQSFKTHNIKSLNFKKDYEIIDSEDLKSDLFDDSRYQNSTRYNCDINEKYESAQLYRQLAKKLHPDSSGNSELFVKYWDGVQDAYKSNNIYRLRLLHLIICYQFSDGFRDKKTEELYLRNELNQLQRFVSGERKKLSYIQTQEPFIFMDKLDDERWIIRRRNSILDKISMIDKEILHNDDLLKNLRRLNRRKTVVQI